jgi:molecular chaperone DnaK (HSP70)
MDIGIDLGTTYSVIALNGKVDLSDEYPKGRYIEECNVTIIPSPDGEDTFPSALWLESGSSDEYLYGYDALQKADEGEAPVLFSKRKMGTKEIFHLQDKGITAKDAAREILSYMKKCAEKALGCPVKRAVITHPAYFERAQVEETRQAAIDAGFDMSKVEQMVMEPIAAALAYTRTDKRDPLRVLTYDLGGGTFDATCLERRGGVLSVRAFDGNNLLGGFNFDRELLNWLLKRLRESGKEIVLNENLPRDRGVIAQLMRIAENLKIELSKHEDKERQCIFRTTSLLRDVRGNQVQVMEKISRAEFERLIEPLLMETIDCCNRVLKKAKWTPEDIHEILLVGGSSYGPWISESLLKTFPNCKVRLFLPDLCVAAGAAIHASIILPPSITQGHCTLELKVPGKSPIDVIDIQGSLKIQGNVLPDGLSVILCLPTGKQLPEVKLNKDGVFTFSDIRLLDGETSKFKIEIRRSGSEIIIGRDFEIVYDPEGIDVSSITTVLPKPLFVETLDGLVPLAEEGVSLPAKREINLIRDNNKSSISIRIFQEMDPIGSINVRDISAEGGKGSKVAINVSVTEKNQIIGNAKIVNPSGKTVKDSDIEISFDPPEIPSLAILHEIFYSYVFEYKNIIESYDIPVEFKKDVIDNGEPLLSKIENLFLQQPVERMEIHFALKKLGHILKIPVDEMVPTRKQFMHGISDCRSKIQNVIDELNKVIQEHGNGDKTTAGAGTKPGNDQSKSLDSKLISRSITEMKKMEQYSKTLDKIEKDGLKAHAEKDKRAWGSVNETLISITSRLRESKGKEFSGFTLKIIAALEVERQKAHLAQKAKQLDYEGRYPEWQDEILSIDTDLSGLFDKVMQVSMDIPSDQARSQYALLMNQLQSLTGKIKNLGVDTHKA